MRYVYYPDRKEFVFDQRNMAELLKNVHEAGRIEAEKKSQKQKEDR